ncbi:hypothetical protein BGW39_004565 [Mortierella sp. 14UC]|nr:hypothetical protein BGW39_004565 [Mortierella sp. 14UC]
MPLAVLPEELWDLIALDLDVVDFATLALLNKESNGRWTPHLYHTISITDETREQALISDNGQAGLRRNARFVKVVFVRTNKGLALDILGALDADLLDLNTLFVRWLCPKEIEFSPLIRLLERSSNLCHLKIANVHKQPIETLLMTIARGMPRLQSLSLFKDDEPIVRPMVVREFLENCSSELEMLTLGVDCASDDKVIKEDLEAMRLAGPVHGSKTHPKLKCFHFAEDDWLDTSESILPAILTTFLEGCPCLEIVDHWKFWQGDRTSWIFNHKSILDPVRKVLNVHLLPGFLNSLNVNNIMDDRALANVISELGVRDNGMQEVWQSIELRVHPEPREEMPETSRAIAKATLTRGLQKIYIGNGDGMQSQDLEFILHHGRDLRIFRCYSYPTLTVTDPSKLLPWNCRWLNSLHLQIGGIPRPDVKVDYRSEPIPAGTPLHSGTMEESRKVQRKIYGMLAELSCLEELRLGQESRTDGQEHGLLNGEHVCYDSNLQSACLEMTLESGMGVLAALRSMQFLQVENMEHRIGVRELWWMQRNWPNLYNVVGAVARTRTSQYVSGRTCGSDPVVLDCGVNFQIG